MRRGFRRYSHGALTEMTTMNTTDMLERLDECAALRAKTPHAMWTADPSDLVVAGPHWIASCRNDDVAAFVAAAGSLDLRAIAAYVRALAAYVRALETVAIATRAIVDWANCNESLDAIDAIRALDALDGGAR